MRIDLYAVFSGKCSTHHFKTGLQSLIDHLITVYNIQQLVVYDGIPDVPVAASTDQCPAMVKQGTGSADRLATRGKSRRRSNMAALALDMPASP